MDDIGVAAWGAEQRAEYDSEPVERLARELQVPCVVAYAQIRSTLDAAHALAARGAEAGTVIVADSQTAGRGRNGRAWSSPTGKGVWLTVIERPVDRKSLDVLSLRIGLEAADALDRFAESPIRLKWPNDLYVGEQKLGGILVEARWRDDRLEWVAIGVGVNVIPPSDQPGAGGLAPNIHRIDVVRALVPAIRAAAGATGLLSEDERARYVSRDLTRGRRCTEPIRGRVQGVSPSGELMVEVADSLVCVRSGSLVLE